GAPPTPISTLFPYTTLFRSCSCLARLAKLREIEARQPDEASGQSWAARGNCCQDRLDPGTGISGLRQQGGLRLCRRSRRYRRGRSEEHTSELQSLRHLVCRL